MLCAMLFSSVLNVLRLPPGARLAPPALTPGRIHRAVLGSMHKTRSKLVIRLFLTLLNGAKVHIPLVTSPTQTRSETRC